jgi:hypothetical protein
VEKNRVYTVIILINNITTFNEYYDIIKNQLDRYNNLQYGYHNEQISRFLIKTWNVDNHRNLKIIQTNKAANIQYSTISKNGELKRTFTSSAVVNKWYNSLIKPLSLLNSKGKLIVKNTKPIFTLDLETINFNNSEIPIAISSSGYYKGIIDNQIFLIDKDLLIKNHELAVFELWKKYFLYLENIIKNDNTITNKLTIFAHNLGDFDGYFLHKGLLNYYPVNEVNSLIDESNTFISILVNHGFQFEWKDSLRIFPTSLDKLCQMFAVEGKNIKYNPKFRNIKFLNDPILLQEFIEFIKTNLFNDYVNTFIKLKRML